MPTTFTTQVQVANLALDMIGANTISSFEDSTVEAQKMKAYYELFVRQAFGKHEWNFSLTEYQATLLETSPIPQWEYAYTLPADMLQLKSAFLSNSAGDRAPYKNYQLFENNTLCTDSGNGIWIHYLKRVYETRWPAYFIDYVAHHLATKLCPIIGRQMGLQKQLFDLTYGAGGNSVFSDACTQDSTQHSIELWNTSYLQTSRESY